MLVFWWQQSKGEGLYPVQGDGVFPGPGTVSRYMLPVMVGPESGRRSGELHAVEQGGLWCSHRGWLRPYRGMCTAKGPTARCNLWGWMSLSRASARVWERPSLIDEASAHDAAGFRHSVMMPVIMWLCVASDSLAGGALMRGMAWSSWRSRALHRAVCRCWASLTGVCMPVLFGFLLGRCALWKGVGREGA